MKKAVFLLALVGCGPVAPNLTKSQSCSIPSDYLSRYNSVTINDSWDDVIAAMGEAPTAVDRNTQVYTHCKNIVFKFDNWLLVDKLVE